MKGGNRCLPKRPGESEDWSTEEGGRRKRWNEEGYAREQARKPEGREVEEGGVNDRFPRLMAYSFTKVLICVKSL